MGSFTESGIYLGTALATVLWSVWIYLAWVEKAGLPEDSPLRFLAIFSPSAYLLAMALAGWQGARLVRLDLAGLVALDGLTLLCGLALLLRGFRGEQARRGCVSVLFIYNGAAVLLILVFHLVRAFPPLLIGLASLLGQARRIDLFSLAWVGLDPETHRQDLTSMLNKLLIALLSYIPIAALRAMALARQRRRMQRELVALRRKIEQIEGILAGAQAERGSVTVKVVP